MREKTITMTRVFKSVIYCVLILGCFLGVQPSFGKSRDNFVGHSIEYIRYSWFALNTYVVDNRARQPRDQSFSYGDLGHFVYDIGSMVHVFDGMPDYEVTKFLIELKSYAINDGGIAGDLSMMINERTGASRAAKEFLKEPKSPCARLYSEHKETELVSKRSAYCMDEAQWREVLQSLLINRDSGQER